MYDTMIESSQLASTVIVGVALLYLFAGLANPSWAFASGRGAVVLRAGLAMVLPPRCSSASSPIRIRSLTARTRPKATSTTISPGRKRRRRNPRRSLRVSVQEQTGKTAGS